VKNSVILFILLILSTPAYCIQTNPLSEAKALFDMKEYYKGLTLLNKAQRDKSLDPVYQAGINTSLARFNEEIVGDIPKALRYYRAIQELDLPPDQEENLLAKKEIQRIETLRKQFRSQDRLLDSLSTISDSLSTGDHSEKYTSRLLILIKDHPDYYRLSEAHYYLGLLLSAAKKHREAYNSFQQAANIKPGIDFFHPVKTRADRSLRDWAGSFFNKLIRGCPGLLLILTVITFYLSRPWRWLRFRHIVFGLLMVILWFVVFKTSFSWLGHNFQVTGEVTGEIIAEDLFEQPLFIKAAPGSPDAQIAQKLFYYGLAGIAGIFLFSIGVYNWKQRWTAFTVIPIFGVLLFASLVSLFCVRYYDSDILYHIIKGRDINRITGNLYFDVDDPEPYVLTEPKGYPNLKLLNVTDSYFKEWVLRYCPDPKLYE